MAQHRLHHNEQAQIAVTRLREAVKQPRWVKNAEACTRPRS
jgi:hypothetical protein